jgi:hypothetical protein
MNRKPFLIGAAVVLFCAAQCRWLLSAWLHSPFDHFGWVVFGIWLCPVAFGLFRSPPPRPAEWLLVTAAGCSVAGAALDFNALRYIGLALSLVSFLPSPAPGALLWAGAAVAWMPVFGFLGSSIGLAGVLAARFGMICLSLLLFFAMARQRAHSTRLRTALEDQKAPRATGTAIRARL